tara:strand:+ start:187 stop:597 length:411 start_codon:yes stop_codon:yes gene_type:complete
MINYLIYNHISGKIDRLYVGAASSVATQLQSGEAFILNSGNVNDLTHYVSSKTITPKPANPITADKTTIIANDNDEITFSNIPNPTDVTITGPDNSIMTFTETDETLIFTTDLEGSYKFNFECFPKLDKVIEIVAS